MMFIIFSNYVMVINFTLFNYYTEHGLKKQKLKAVTALLLHLF